MFTLLLCAAMCGADDTRQELVDRYIMAVAESRKNIDAEIAAVGKGRVTSQVRTATKLPNGNYVFPNRQQRDAMLAALKGKSASVRMPTRKIEVGDIGTDIYDVRQVLGPDSVLCERKILVGYSARDRSPVYDEDLVIISGVSTTGLTNTSDRILGDVVLIATGTKTYRTIDSGTNTVVVVSPLTEDELKRIDGADGKSIARSR